MNRVFFVALLLGVCFILALAGTSVLGTIDATPPTDMSGNTTYQGGSAAILGLQSPLFLSGVMVAALIIFLGLFLIIKRL